MDGTKVKAIIQEAINQELKEIFGFGRKSTEKLTQTDTETIPQQENFSMEKLKNLRTSKEIRRYTQITLGDEELGRGQARVAYLVGNDKVLKVALSDNKAYQNQNEITNSKCLGSRYTPKIYDFDPRFSWILTEHVNQTKSTEVLVQKLNELTGLDQEEELRFGNSFDVQDFFSDLAALTARENVLPKYQTRHDFLMSHSEWYQGLVKNLIGCKVSTWDFHKNNWGIRPSTGELVLLDVGFNPAEPSPENGFFKEFITKVLREELNSSSEFSLEHLKTLKSLHDILDYCFYTLGSKPDKGAARFSWNLNDSQVLKVARELKYVDQNQQELKNIKCMGERYAVKVYDFDRTNQFWIIEERVKAYPTAFRNPAFLEKINAILGTDYGDWYPVMELFATQKYNETKERLLKTNDWFRGIIQALEGCDVGSNDLHPGNWGIRPGTGELVILDLGF